MASQLFPRTIRFGKGFRIALGLTGLIIALAFGSRTAALAQTPQPQPSQATSPVPKMAVPGPLGAPVRNYVFLDSTKGEENEEAEAKPSDAEHQNIKMHGHWVIDVKNPDGTVAEHRDFHNSITKDGQETLIALMAGYWVISDYEIFLQPAEGATGPCTPPTNGAPGCVIVRSLTTQPGLGVCTNVGYYCATGLTYTYNLSYSSPSSMVLAGSVTATQAGTLTSVSTVAGYCQNSSSNAAIPTAQANVSPASCTATPASEAGYVTELSSAFLNNAPISVLSGQIIQVTVTISFS